MKYDRANLADTCRVARKLAQKDGRLRFVQATAYGYVISLKDPKINFQDYYCIGAENYVLIKNGKWGEKRGYPEIN